MIDEDLYRRAAEELNSEHRQPDTWARACALANDDHDEARYLYTNLRVEELLAEAEGVASGHRDTVMSHERATRDATDGDRVDPEADASRASSLDPGTDDRVGIAADARADTPDGNDPPRHEIADEIAGDTLNDIEARDESAERGSTPQNSLDTLFANAMASHDSPDDRNAPLSSSDLVAARELDETETDDTALEFEAEDGSVVETVEAEEIDDTVAIHSPRHASSDSARGFDDLDRLDEEYRAERLNLGTQSQEPPDLEDGSDAMARELRRQADGVSTDDQDSYIAHEPLDTLPMRRVGRDVTRSTERQVSSSMRAAHSADTDDAPSADEYDTASRDDAFRDTASHDTASHDEARTTDTARDDEYTTHDHATDDADTTREPSSERADAPYAVATNQPLELTDGDSGRREYAVFTAPSPDDRVQTVRQGGSWGALLATTPWLLYRRLIGTAIVYVLFAVAVLVGLGVTGLTWLGDGEATSFATRATTIGFALIAFAGLIVVPFRYANHWRENKLEQRGFQLVAYVQTPRPERAIELAREATDPVA